MYPTVVMVLVQTQRSMVDVCEISPSNASKIIGPVASKVRVSVAEPWWARTWFRRGHSRSKNGLMAD